uniref:Uncharacterized protein n=1 Tax=Tanacetum cinerariifolium TaxID=118510 RepID=A0A6L2NB49_TANCI|nr:hypothetical protein [Tanacetum cinerariifolium]
MLMTMKPEIQQNLKNLHAHEILLVLKTLFSQQAERELFQTTRDFHSCKQEEGQSVSSYVLKMKGYIDNLEHLGNPVTRGLGSWEGENKIAYAPKPKIPPPPKREDLAKDSICHACGNTGYWKRNYPQYLVKLLKKKKNIASGAGGSGIFVIELNTILNRLWIYDTGCGTHICNTTQGLRASRKLKPGALNSYVVNGQRKAVEAIGVFNLYLPSGLEIVLNNCHYASSINKGVILFHKKRIEKLQHDGLLNSIDLRYFEKCVPYMSGKMDHGIIDHRTPPYTSQHNGVSKRRNRTLLDMVRSMTSQTTLPKSFWDYALETVARIFNMVPTKKGCEALVKRDTLTKPDKLEPRSIKCIFIGYPKETMGYSFYYPPENNVLVARNAEFLDNSLITQEASESLEDLEIIQEEDTHPFIDTSLNHKEDDQEIDEPQSDIVPIRRSTRTLHASNRMCLYIDDVEHELGDLASGSSRKRPTWMELYTYKAHLVANGYTQTPGIDYEETFSSVADIRAIRILIAIAAYYDYKIWKMDVKTAFLNGYLNEEVYMKEPKASGSNITFLILYVDDILIMGNNIPMLQDVKSYLGRCFAMKDLGEAAYILGIKIYRDRSRRLIGASTPAELKRMQNVPYASAVGSIMYALRCTRPDVAFAQNVKGQFQQNPGDLHWTTVKNILKYLKNTKDMFLVYGGDLKQELRVSCYTNTGYLTDAEDIKSQTRYVFILNGGVVDWKSAKQSIFATSSAEAEYIAAFDASKEVVWVRKIISGLGVIPIIEEPISMYCDNTGAIAIANESGITKDAKHFCAKVHYLREVIEYGDVKLKKVHTYDNLAEPSTKALAFPKHSENTRNIGMLPANSLM